jgi:hypothetical protein
MENTIVEKMDKVIDNLLVLLGDEAEKFIQGESGILVEDELSTMEERMDYVNALLVSAIKRKEAKGFVEDKEGHLHFTKVGPIQFMEL